MDCAMTILWEYSVAIFRNVIYSAKQSPRDLTEWVDIEIQILSFLTQMIESWLLAILMYRIASGLFRIIFRAQL